ncbi:MAG: hypothetical protein ACK4XM_12480, partial [Chloroherpetonaceae bacterium]
VGDYSVAEHVFLNQQVKGFLNTESSVGELNVSIFVCEKSNNATYSRYEYTDVYDGMLEVINVCPSVSFSNQDDVEHLRASVELSPSFPIEKVFAKYFDLQNQPFSQSNETDSLFAFLRITNKDGKVIVDGIIDTQDGRFQFQFGNTSQSAKRVEKVSGTTETFTYRLCESITIETYSASTILSVVEMVDNVSDKVEYDETTNLSSGKGFIDYLSNRFAPTATVFQRLTKLIDSFVAYINESVLSEVGIYRGESQTIYQGIKQLCAVTTEPSTTFNHGVEQRFNDVVEMLFNWKDCIWTDTFGTGTQANGEKRGVNVERTRGLRNSDGFFPDKQKELPFSFLQYDTAQELLADVLDALQFTPSFEVRQIVDSTTGISRYVMDMRLSRAYHDGGVWQYDTTLSSFVPLTNNVLEIDKTQQTLNQIDDGEIDDETIIIRQLDQKTPILISTREIFGAGQEWNKDTVNDGFFNRIEYRVVETNPVRAVSSRLKRIETDLLFASARLTKRELQEYSPSILGSFNRLISLSGRYPTYFAVNFRDRPRIRDFFAEAYTDYVRLTKNDARAEIYESVQISNVDTLAINAGTIVRTNILHDSNALVDYVIRQATIDHIGKCATLTLERVREPFGKIANTDTTYNAAVVFDKAVIALNALASSRFGVLRRRVFIPSVSYDYTSPFLFFAMGNDTTTMIDYKSTPSNTFGNAYEGYDVKWNETLDLNVYREDELIYTKASAVKTSDLPLSDYQDIHNKPARYQFEIKDSLNPNRIKHLRADSSKGCLLIRNRRAYCRIDKFENGVSSPLIPSPTNNHKFAVRVGFAYKGKVKVMSLLTTSSRIFEIYANEDGIYITHIYFSQSWFVPLQRVRNNVIDLFVKFEFNNPSTFNFEVIVNGNTVTPQISTETFATLRLDYEASIVLPNLIGATNDDKSFIAVLYAKAIQYNSPSFAPDLLYDLGFDNIFAINADEAFSSQLTETKFVEDSSPNASLPSFSVVTSPSPFISIQKANAATLRQV